jgi:ribonuclease-3
VINNNLNNLEIIIGYHFKQTRLLAQALVHRSYLNESKDKNIGSNERLEFLGDTVLGFIVSEWLYEDFPNSPEGTLTNLRSALVKAESLAKIARKLELGKYLSLSRGEIDSGGQQNPSLLANCLEAIIGAIFLDRNLTSAKLFVKPQLKPLLEDLLKNGELKDGKSLLQEKLQAKYKIAPVYRTLKEEGPDHQRIFTIGVFNKNEQISSAVGKSKQEAEEAAAQTALEKLNI